MLRTGKTILQVLLTVGLLLFGYFAVAGEMPGPADSAIVDRAMGHGDAGKVVVARVNGAKISMAKLMDRMLDIAQKRYGRREITPLLAEKIRGEALGQLITGELAFQFAGKVVSVSSEEVRDNVDERIKIMGGEENFAKYLLAAQFKSRSEFEKQIMKFMVVQKYITAEIEPKIIIRDADIAAAYKDSAGSYFNRPEMVQVTKVVFFMDPAMPGSYEKIKQVRSKIINELGGDPTKLTVDGTFIVQENIKLHTIADKELYDIAKKLDKFGLSEVVEMNGTLHLVQLTGYQVEVTKSLEEVSGYLRNELTSRVRRALIDEWMGSLRNGAEIEIVDLEQ